MKPAISDALAQAGVEAHWHTARPVLSRYARSPAEQRVDPLMIVDHRPPFGRGPRVVRIEEVTDLFDRYERAMRIERVYVLPEEKAKARAALGTVSAS